MSLSVFMDHACVSLNQENQLRNKSNLNIFTMEKTIGFIGGGRVTKILLQGFKNKNLKFGKVVVTDTNPEVIANLKKLFPEVEEADAATSARQDIVFIALHPPAVMDTLDT